MQKINFNNLNQYVYYFTLKNGFKVYIVPFKNKKNYYAVLGTKFGSMDINFQVDDIKYSLPFGTAHFLEHKIFEQENEENPFKFFAKSGVNANASTSFSNTRYYIWGVNEIEKNLNYLLDLIYSPYFTDENISKEKGIIKEEILMYEDNPIWALEDCMRENLFFELPVKEKIAGTVESINKITRDDLFNAYNNFYHPSNMCLVIGGNVDYKKIEKIILNHSKLNNFEENKSIIRKVYKEPDIVKEEFKKIYMNLNVPKVNFSIKLNKNKFKGFDDIKINMYLGIILSILFGSTSNFKEEVISKNLTTGYIEEKNNYGDFIILNIMAESDKADILLEKVKETFKNIKINKIDLERIKKVWIASEIRMIDNVEITVDNIYSDLINYNKLYENRIEIIKSLNIQELRKFTNLLDLSNQSLVMALPSSEKEYF